MSPYWTGSCIISIVIGKRTKVGIAVPQTFPDGPFDISVIEENLKLIESPGLRKRVDPRPGHRRHPDS